MLQNVWLVAAPTSRVRKRPLAIRAHDQDYVAFRDDAGQAHVLLDRCPHRGVALSRGTLEGGHLTCSYHGWQFGGDGRCARIPSLRDDQRIPAGIAVPVVASVEQDGFVWLWHGTGEPTGRPLAIPEFERGRWIQNTLSMDCHWLKPLENNVDPTHAAFAHRWTHPQWFSRKLRGLSDGSTEVRITATGFELFAPATMHPEDPIPTDAAVIARFDLPDRVTVTLKHPFRQVIVIFSVPTGPHSCRVETLVSNPLPFGGKLRFSGWEHPIFRQDRKLMESAERWTRHGHDFERSVEADYSMLLLRRIVDLAENGLWEHKRSSLQERRILRIRA